MKSRWEEVYRKEMESYSWEPAKAIKKFLTKIKQTNAKKILDLGCGIGRNAVYLAKKGYIVVGVDISDAALQTASIRTNTEKINNIVLLHSDIRSLPFPNKHFDVVFSINVLHHDKLENIQTAMNEVLRVLCLGGLGMVTLVSVKDYKFGKGKEVEENTFELFEGTHGEKGILHHFFDEHESEYLLKDFQIIQKEHITEEVEGGKNCHWYIVFQKMAQEL